MQSKAPMQRARAPGRARQGLVWVVSAVATLATSAAGCRSSERDGSSKAAAQVADFKSRAAALAKPLAQVRAAVPDPGQLAEMSCPDDALRLKLDGGYTRALLADFDYLGWYHKVAQNPYQGPKERWNVLTARSLLSVAHPDSVDNRKTAIDALYRLKGLRAEHEYVAVVRATQQRLPRLDGAIPCRSVSGVADGV